MSLDCITNHRRRINLLLLCYRLILLSHFLFLLFFLKKKNTTDEMELQNMGDDKNLTEWWPKWNFHFPPSEIFFQLLQKL